MNENESATTTFPTTKAAQTSETTPQAATIAAIKCVGCNSSTRSVWPFFFCFYYRGMQVYRKRWVGNYWQLE